MWDDRFVQYGTLPYQGELLGGSGTLKIVGCRRRIRVADLFSHLSSVLQFSRAVYPSQSTEWHLLHLRAAHLEPSTSPPADHLWLRSERPAGARDATHRAAGRAQRRECRGRHQVLRDRVRVRVRVRVRARLHRIGRDQTLAGQLLLGVWPVRQRTRRPLDDLA